MIDCNIYNYMKVHFVKYKMIPMSVETFNNEYYYMVCYVIIIDYYIEANDCIQRRTGAIIKNSANG